MKLVKWLEAVRYQTSGGDQFLWSCYGPGARSFSYWNNESGEDEISSQCIFNPRTEKIREITMYDGPEGRCYRWIDPKYVDEFVAECKRMGIRPEEYSESVDFEDIDTAKEMLDIIRSIFVDEAARGDCAAPVGFEDAGNPKGILNAIRSIFGNEATSAGPVDVGTITNQWISSSVQTTINNDDREVVPINLADDEIFALMKTAHDRDITLNDLVNEILRSHLSDQQ